MKAKRRVGRYQPSRSNGQTQSLTLGAGVYTYTYLQDPVTVVVVTTRQMLGPEVNNIMATTITHSRLHPLKNQASHGRRV